MRILLTSLTVLLLFACQNDDTPSKKTVSDPLKTDAGTQQMLDSLERIYTTTNFKDHPYYSDEKIAIFEKEISQFGDQIPPQIKLNYATNLLTVGRVDESVSIFKEILQLLPHLQEINDQTKKLHEIYAVTLMRKGEIDNCIENHSSESCIMPIQGKGVHVNTTGSSEAIKIYEKILAKYPDDLQSRWLLNLAYQTLGLYPEKVPAQWLIPEKAFQSEIPFPKFENVAMNLGLDINLLAGGVISDDFNNDGYIDLVISSWHMNDPIQLFINKGDGTFTETTEQAGLKGMAGGLNLRQADYNNDGYLDILVLRGAWVPRIKMGIQPNSLLHNNGDGTFKDVTIAAGLYSLAPTQTACWMDYNQDGWIDLFVGNETNVDNQNYEAFPCEFYHNNGDGTFTNIAAEVGLDLLVYTKGATDGDVNNDGYPDIYISNLIGENLLFVNKGKQSDGKWAFEEIAGIAGVQEPNYSFPCWFFDSNNDGWDDLFVSSFDMSAFTRQAAAVAADYLGQPSQSDAPRLYLNNGLGSGSDQVSYQDITSEAKLIRALGTMGCNFGDIDNNGFQDFYLATGAPDFRSVVPNRMFCNLDGNKFVDVTHGGGFGNIQKGHGVSFADLDNDGDTDVYAVMGGSYSGDNFQNSLFENPGNDNNWITIQLEGTKANKAAIGSKVELNVSTTDGKSSKIYRTVTPGASFGANSLQLEVGIGKAVKIDDIRVNWSNGNNTYISYGSTGINQKVKITEGKQEIETVPMKGFKFSTAGGGHHHHH